MRQFGEVLVLRRDHAARSASISSCLATVSSRAATRSRAAPDLQGEALVAAGQFGELVGQAAHSSTIVASGTRATGAASPATR